LTSGVADTRTAHFPKKQTDPEFRTKPRIAADLVTQALAAGVACRAVVADSFYGDHDALRGPLSQSGLGFVMSLKPSRGTWQYGAEAYTPKDAARAVPWGGPDNPGGWHPVQRVRHRYPTPPNPGPLRVLILLEHLVRPTHHHDPHSRHHGDTHADLVGNVVRRQPKPEREYVVVCRRR
jgi:hypothetical protein